MIPSRMASRQNMPSTAAPAPIRWPVIDFVELTGVSYAAGPKTDLMAYVSARSPFGVDVAWALM
jgi:hypothetical protein